MTPIDYYRAEDATTLTVGVTTTPGAWTRATGVEESPSSVRITVSTLEIGVAGAGVAEEREIVVRLKEPIGDRAVIDGSNGSRVVRTTCHPPAYLAPGCTIPSARP